MTLTQLRVVSVVGTRPEIIRLSRVLCELDKFCDHVIVHSGQNYDYELNEIFFSDLEIRKPDFFLNATNGSSSPAETIGKIISGIDPILEEINPEAFLVLGDTNSCLAAIAAKKRKIPVFHMEAGNRCFDMRVPEETNRKIIDAVADINLPYTDIAREYLLAEGFPADFIVKTGSPIKEVLDFYDEKIKSSDVLSRMELEVKDYFLVSMHREENVEEDSKFDAFARILNILSEDYGLPIIVSTHPRTKQKLDGTNVTFHKLINFAKPLGYFDYVQLQLNAKLVLSDSGTITEEASILGFPAVNLRETHERPEGMEEGAVMMVGMSVERIKQAINILEYRDKKGKRKLDIVKDYNVDNVSKKVVGLIHSYTDYVKQKNWRQ